MVRDTCLLMFAPGSVGQQHSEDVVPSKCLLFYEPNKSAQSPNAVPDACLPKHHPAFPINALIPVADSP